MRVSVVVPVHNGIEFIEACLGSVPGDTEIVVVDDCSTDGAPERVRQTFHDVALLSNERNLGFGASVNRGLHACGGDVAVVLNSDARLKPSALDSLVSVFSRADVGIAGPRLVFPDGSHQTSAARFPTPGSIVTGAFLLNEAYRRVFPNGRFRWELGMAERDHAFTHDVDWVMGTCLAIRRECWTEIGAFDERYFLYAEETDLCWRARRAGWGVMYVAEAVVEHAGGGSTGDPVVHARRSIASEALFMRTAYGAERMWRWRAARLLSAALKIPILAAAAPFDRRVRGRLAWQVSALRAVAAMHCSSQ